MPGRVLVVRPGLIVGPHDASHRFTYWPSRVARGGEVLAPGRPGRPVQFIDVRDLAEWLLRLVEARHTGVLNATGPAQRLSMGGLLEACRQVTGSGARFSWVADEFLLERGVGPYVEMPLWVPEAEAAGFDQFDIRRAAGTGLTFRPLADTIRATLEWDATLPVGAERRAGLAPEREAALLAEWHQLPARTAA
jgi:2'-hydroxyisoflavone reductase